jgi:hypothetical protein
MWKRMISGNQYLIVTPPGIERQQQLSNNNVPLLLNEQSISLKFNSLTEKGITRLYLKP